MNFFNSKFKSSRNYVKYSLYSLFKTANPCTVQREKSPSFIFCLCCQQANLTLGEFQCLKLLLFKHKRFWANSRRKETASIKGGKLNAAKITLYKVSLQ